MDNTLGFDRISVMQGDKAGSHYTPEQFVALPVSERVKMVLGGRLAFYCRNEEVDRRQSLNALRQWSAQMS